MARVLIIEDDLAIRSALKRVLTDRGDVVAVAGTGMEGMTILMREQPDIVLLDLGLPDLDGFGVLGMLRAVSEVPVIVITAQDDDRSTIRALDAGADDYVTKPFGADQVAARMRAVLRRSRREPDEEDPALVIGDLVIDPRSREVTLAGNPVGTLPQGVRRPARAREPGRCRRHQARAADRGLAAALRWCRPDGRCPPELAAPKARRDGRRAALPAERPGRRRTVGEPRWRVSLEATHHRSRRADLDRRSSSPSSSRSRSLSGPSPRTGDGDDRPDGPQRGDPGVGDQRALPARVAGGRGGGDIGRGRRRDLPRSGERLGTIDHAR